LGNWYYRGAGKENYSHCTSFHNLEEPHERVHTSGLAAVNAARSGDIKTAAMHLSAMEKASLEVADALDRLNSEIVHA